MQLAEDGNPHDRSAVSLWIDGLLVGYLPRDQASALRPGLLAAQEREGKPIALEGVIVKGAMRGDEGSRLSEVLRMRGIGTLDKTPRPTARAASHATAVGVRDSQPTCTTPVALTTEFALGDGASGGSGAEIP
jgi:hypothetical protein